MKLNISAQEWKDAKIYFNQNPKAVKMKKANPDVHSFIKVGKMIYALARKQNLKEGSLGNGAQGIVKLGQSQRGKIVAVKIEPADKPPRGERWTEDSFKIMKKIGFLKGHVLRKLKGLKKFFKIDTHTKSYTILEYIDGHPLIDILQKYRKNASHLSLLQEYLIALQCCNELLKLHQSQIIHGDIKPENIMVILNPVDKNDIKVKYVDYNFSRLLKKDQHTIQVSVAPGTRRYAAPDIVFSGIFSFSSDIFALGRMLQYCFPHLQDLAREMCTNEPKTRASLQEAMAFILNKINMCAPLDGTTLTLMQQTKSIVEPYFRARLQEGLHLDYILNLFLPHLLLTKEQNFIIGLKCAQAVLAEHAQGILLREISPEQFRVFVVKDDIRVEFNRSDNWRSAINFYDFSKDPLSHVSDYLTKYLAPESITHQEFSFGSDTYSVGKILSELGIDPGLMLSPHFYLRTNLAQLILNLINHSQIEFSSQGKNLIASIKTYCQDLLSLMDSSSLEDDDIYRENVMTSNSPKLHSFSELLDPNVQFATFSPLLTDPSCEFGSEKDNKPLVR